MKYARVIGVLVSAASIALIHARLASAAGTCFLISATVRQQERSATAREQLSALNVPYSEEEFVSSAARGDDRIVDLFLASGLSPDAKNRDGFTGLMWSAGQGRLSVVKKLLARGADVNARSKDGTTALMTAASRGPAEIA